MLRKPIHLLLLAALLALLALPGAGAGSPPLARGSSDTASAGSEPAGDRVVQRAKKRRCRRVRSPRGARKRRACKKRTPPAPVNRPPQAPASPPAAGAPGSPGSPAPGEDPDYENPEGPPPGPVYEVVDLIRDPGFEDVGRPTGCFDRFSENDGAVAADTAAPIAGANSLSATVSRFGRVGCIHEYGFQEGPIGKQVTLDGKVRIDAPAAGSAPLEVCAVVYFEDSQEPGKKCRTLTPADQGVTEVHLVKETEERRLARVFFQLQAADVAIEATVDDAHLLVEQVKGSEGPRGGGGGGGGGGASGACTDAISKGEEPVPDGPPDPDSPCDINVAPRADTSYQPAPLTLAPQRPFISLADYTQAPATGAIFQAFKRWVDKAVFQDNPGFNYTSTDAVIMFARTGNSAYIDDAIARVEAEVSAAEAAPDGRPVIAGDDYLEVGPSIEALALTYDYGFARLTPQQRERWEAYANRSISNVWSPLTATWGDAPAAAFAWSGWAINDPGNNYNFSFIEATQMWALASKDQRWIDFLQGSKFPLIVDYYAALPGGGSREGTGYGASQRRLWENARMWRRATGEDLTTIRAHARESIEYWINATVPTLDHYAPIGDLSRQSLPELFDYHENLLREAVMAAPGTAQARHGVWWLNHNSVPETLTQEFTLRGALLLPTDAEEAPSALTYRAEGAGQFFARSSWSEDATWLQLTAGTYDQSHAHEDQGGFTLYRDTWQTVTSNIWTHSGLQGGGGGGSVADLGTAVNNVVRFTRPGPSGGPPQTIRQNFSESEMSFETLPGNLVKVHTDLGDAYSNNDDEVHGWTRDLEFQGNRLRVHDTCQVAPGIGAVFGLHVPVQPVDHGGGSITAGPLQIQAGAGTVVNLVDMRSFNPPGLTEFNSGWRIDISNPDGCEFDVNLTALSSP